MKQDAEAHAEEDKKRRELIDLKNRADSMVHQTRKQLEEHGEKVGADVRGKIESALSGVEEKLKGDDRASIEASLTELESSAMELGKVIYEAQAAAGGAPGADAAAEAGTSDAGSTPASGDDDVIDAEYEVKDEKKD
jgi:molecular chaperone DnaK